MRKWITCIPNGKDQLMEIGRDIIYLGILILAISLFYALMSEFPEFIVLVIIAGYIFGILIVGLYRKVKDHRLMKVQINKAYIKVRSGSINL